MLKTETTKVCFKCGETKKLSMFYKHFMMADGHVNKCKECNKKDVIENRNSKLDYYRAYDTERGGRKTAEDTRKYRGDNPLKYKAHSKVGYAVKAGTLKKASCEVCNREDTQAHHNDYSKPLEVLWLCPVCHCDWHKLNGSGING